MRRLASAAATLTLFAVLATAAAPSAHAAPAGAPLRPDGRWLRDQEGRAGILHGVNVVYKRAPYLPSPQEFGPADADAIAALGFNTVRLGFTWSGMMPTPGVVDAAYLDRYTELVDLLGARGVHVLVDAHQDLYTEAFGGEGAPPWATFTDGVHNPGVSPLQWGVTYFTNPALARAFENLWRNRDGIADRYADMWRVVAERFRDRPHVLGYDLLNEPWLGSPWLLPVEKWVLEPFLRRIAAAVRAVDAVHPVFWEPSLTTQVYGWSGVTDLGVDATVLSFHVYCPVTVFLRRWLHSACAGFEAAGFTGASGNRRRAGSSWLLTEFGANDYLDDARFVAGLADSHLVGWQYWAWKLYDDPTGDPDEAIVTSDTGPVVLKDKVAVLERTYARAVAGTPVTMSFDPDSGDFRLVYVPSPEVTAPTEIWLPVERHYPGGAQIAVAGGHAVDTGDPHRVEIVADAGATEVTVDVHR